MNSYFNIFLGRKESIKLSDLHKCNEGIRLKAWRSPSFLNMEKDSRGEVQYT